MLIHVDLYECGSPRLRSHRQLDTKKPAMIPHAKYMLRSSGIEGARGTTPAMPGVQEVSNSALLRRRRPPPPFVLLLLLISTLLLAPRGAAALNDPNHATFGRSRTSAAAAGHCTAYRVDNPYCCSHHLLLCDNICHNGKNWLYPVAAPGAPLCADAAAAAGPRDGVLLPVKCNIDSDAHDPHFRPGEFEAALRSMRGELDTLGMMEERPPGWLNSRAGAIWREGTTYLQALGAPETNIAHFVGKLNSILLLNNATVPTPLGPVDRIMLVRDARFRKGIRRNGDGSPLSWYSSLVRYLAYVALRPRLAAAHRLEPAALDTHPEFLFQLSDAAPDDVAAVSNYTFAFGRLEFEGAMEAATEERPLCWRRLIFPGMMKAIAYVGGLPVARTFKQTIAESVQLPPAPPRSGSDPVRLLYLQRTGKVSAGRRLMVPESLEMLRGIFRRLNFEVSEIEFAGMTFKEQYQIVQGADVIISLHGAALTNACMLSREGTAVIELMPYRFHFDMYRMMAMSSGATFFRHECSAEPGTLRPFGDSANLEISQREALPPGTSLPSATGRANSSWREAARPKDEAYASLSSRQCAETAVCTNYFLHKRAVELGPRDAEQLEVLLGHAHDFALWMRRGPDEAAQRLRARLGASTCLRGVRWDSWNDCRQNLISSPLVDPRTPCVLAQDC